jgi:hypothetical protein
MSKGNEPVIRFQFDVRERDIHNYGLAAVLEEMCMTSEGKVIIPLRLGGGLVMANPAPSGTWERLDGE